MDNILNYYYRCIRKSYGTAMTEDACHAFLMELWGDGSASKECELYDMVSFIVPFLANCKHYCNSMEGFITIANGMRNCYDKDQQSK